MDREERFRELDTEIENWSEDEKCFVLWLLLREYESNTEFPKQIETKKDFMVHRMIETIKKSCNEVIKMLEFELWR